MTLIHSTLIADSSFPEVSPKWLKPVMVWIHGGSFATGSGNGETDIYGPAYFLDRDIVLVTINYRLGPLGNIEAIDTHSFKLSAH